LSRGVRISLLVAAYIVIVLFAGLRWETANDWVPYYEYYQSLTNIQDHSESFEVGYRIVSLISKDIGLPYSAFLLLYSTVYLGIITISFKERNCRYAVWLMLLFYSSFLLGWMGTARQVMANAICLFAVRYLLSKKLRPFVLCVCVASLFHISGLCYLLAWPISTLSIKRLHLWIITFILLIFSLLNGGSLIMRTVGNLLHIPFLDKRVLVYEAISTGDLGTASTDIGFLMYLKRLLFLIFFLAFMHKLSSPAEKIYLNLYLFSLILFVMFAGVIPMIPLRAGLYFSIFELFLLVSLIDRFKKLWARQIYCSILIMLSFGRLYSALYLYHPELYIPYKGVFINTDIIRALY